MKVEKKAKELVDKMYVGFIHQLYSYKAKQCALIAVDEIINSIVVTDLTTAENQFKYWEEVKQKINLL
jgi:hypothetical protein